MDLNEQVGFDAFYDEISKWAVDQKELTYADFAAAEMTTTDNIADFKKTADRML